MLREGGMEVINQLFLALLLIDVFKVPSTRQSSHSSRSYGCKYMSFQTDETVQDTLTKPLHCEHFEYYHTMLGNAELAYIILYIYSRKLHSEYICTWKFDAVISSRFPMSSDQASGPF